MSKLKDPENKKLIDAFMVDHAPLINKHINVLRSQGKIPPHVDEDDLHMAGFHGLMDALHKYDHGVAGRLAANSNQNVFAKYAEKRIRGRMLDHIVSSGEIPKSHLVRAKNLSLLPSDPQETSPESDKTPPAMPPPPKVS